MSILESPHHELRKADGLNLVPPCLCRWEAFSTPRALAHITITWALSEQRHKCQVSFPGPPCAHGVLSTSHGEVCDTHPYETESMPSSTILVVDTLIFKLPSSMVRHYVYLRARPLQCIVKFDIVPKVLFLGFPLATLDLSSKNLTYTRPTYFGTHFGCF